MLPIDRQPRISLTVSATMSEFAKRLKLLMEKRGLNQAELARLSEIERVSITQYLNDSAHGKLPSVRNLIALAKALHCTPNELLGWPEDNPVPTDIMEAAERFAALPEDHWLRKALAELHHLSITKKEDSEKKSDTD